MPPGLVVKNGWKMRASVCSSIPRPESVTSTLTPDVGRPGDALRRRRAPGSLARDRVEAVQQQVEQHLLDLDAVAHELRQRRPGRRRATAMPFVGRLAADETQDLVDHFAQVELGSLHLAAAQEAAQLLDQVADAPVVGDDVRHRRAQLVEVGRRRGEQLGRGLRVGEAGGERLGQLVHERRREHAHRADPGGVGGLRLRFLLAALRRLAREHAGEHLAEELHPREQVHRASRDLRARWRRTSAPTTAPDTVSGTTTAARMPSARSAVQIRGRLGRKVRVAGEAHDRAARRAAR